MVEWNSHFSFCCFGTTDTCCTCISIFWTMSAFHLVRECFVEDRYYFSDGNFSDVLKGEKKVATDIRMTEKS